MQKRMGFAVLVAALALATTSLQAQVLTPTNRGWINSDDVEQGPPFNFIAGRFDGLEFRNFFTFDLTAYSGTIGSSTLSLYNPANVFGNTSADYQGYISPDATETYQLTSTGTFDFAGLGTGTVFSSVTMSAADNGQWVSLVFNADGLAALNAAVGGTITFGGRVTTLGDDRGTEVVFGFSNFSPAPTLTLATSTVPEPSTYALMGAGLAGLGVMSRRRRRAAVL